MRLGFHPLGQITTFHLLLVPFKNEMTCPVWKVSWNSLKIKLLNSYCFPFCIADLDKIWCLNHDGCPIVVCSVHNHLTTSVILQCNSPILLWLYQLCFFPMFHHSWVFWTSEPQNTRFHHAVCALWFPCRVQQTVTGVLGRKSLVLMLVYLPHSPSSPILQSPWRIFLWTMAVVSPLGSSSMRRSSVLQASSMHILMM